MIRPRLSWALVQDARDAQMLLEFGASVERRVSGWVTNTRRDKDKRREESITTPAEQKIHAGAGTVYVVRDGRFSLVESFADEKRIFFERDPQQMLVLPESPWVTRDPGDS